MPKDIRVHAMVSHGLRLAIKGFLECWPRNEESPSWITKGNILDGFYPLNITWMSALFDGEESQRVEVF